MFFATFNILSRFSNFCPRTRTLLRSFCIVGWVVIAFFILVVIFVEVGASWFCVAVVGCLDFTAPLEHVSTSYCFALLDSFTDVN